MPETLLHVVDDGVARIVWTEELTTRGWQAAVDVVRREVAKALIEHERVEARIRTDDEDGHRIAIWSGLRREGVQRSMRGNVVVYARLADDTPVEHAGGFRALLNSFLPRKRAISQMLIRDTSAEPRVLLCQLTYKPDWDLPGGVVEVGESPHLAVAREVEEELALTIPAGQLLLTDWMPPWGGWDDALCLVFDGGAHEPGVVDQIVPQQREIRTAAFLTLAEVEELAAEFTARRVRAALANLGGGGPAYTESGR